MSAVLAATAVLQPLRHGEIEEMLAIENDVCRFPWTYGNFADALASGYSVWGCRVAGELVGYFVLMLVVDEAQLLNIGVAAKRQGMGYGADLLRQALRVARQAGADSILLEVRPSNDKALTLYRHFGFRQIGLRRDYYPADGGREDAMVMRYAWSSEGMT